MFWFDTLWILSMNKIISTNLFSCFYAFQPFQLLRKPYRQSYRYNSKTPISKSQFQSIQSYLESPSTDHPFIHSSKTTYSINTPNEQQISASYNHMDSSKANKAKLTRHPMSMIDRRAGKSDVTFFIPMKGKGERNSVRK